MNRQPSRRSDRPGESASMSRMRASSASAFLLASALAAILPGSRGGAAASPRAVLPFIADDYTKAVAEARARKVPLFIESWAPW